MNEHPIIDASMMGVTLGAAIGFIPSIAALLAAAWYGVQIWESETGKKLRAKLWPVAPISGE